MPPTFIGLMSGTSADAVDGTAVSFDNGAVNIQATQSDPISPSLRGRIIDIMRGRGDYLDAQAALDRQSPVDIAGQETLFEHVHFTFSGNHQLALLFAESIAAQLKITNSRLRMFWPRKFSRSLEKHLPEGRKPDEYGLGMRLSKLNGNSTEFDVQLIEEARVINDAHF